MELRAFLNLFLREKKMILLLVLASVGSAFFAYRLQSQWYANEMLLSVTRTGSEAATEYQYDQFYRLQADERMADTVARYLESAVGRRAVADEAGFSPVQREVFVETPVSALRLSSNIIRVGYRTDSLIESDRLADAFYVVGEGYVASLNERTESQNWFTLVSSEPVARDGRFTLPIALLLGLAAGLFIAFWTVLGRWYWQASDNRKA